MSHSQNKGFTLIELLVVIAIVAILATVVILTLNPAELLKQARDVTRLSDISTLKSAIGVYLADVSSPSIGTAGLCYMATASANPANCGFNTSATPTVNNSFAVNGGGWIPINMTQVSSGSPLGNLPKDPTNVTPYVYRYIASPSALTFKLMAPLESAKYTTGAASSTALSDGGSSSTAYETGTDLSL
jgi:prepilin-type N-terminal cleavage/methylation domain-containing protein